MANIDFTQTMRDFDGKPIQDGRIPVVDNALVNLLERLCEHAPEALQAEVEAQLEAWGNIEGLTLSSIALNVLGNRIEGDNPDGEEKFKRFELGLQIRSAGIVDLDPKQIVMLEELIGKGYSAIVVGQAWNMLRGKWKDGKPMVKGAASPQEEMGTE